jgi:hypothetical protein
MSKALNAKLIEQRDNFRGIAIEKGRPYGKYGGVEGEFVSRQFGQLKGFYSWKEMTRNGVPTGEIELNFIPSDRTLPQIRDEYEKDRGSEFKIYGRPEVGLSNPFGGGNLKHGSDEERAFTERGMTSASRR